MPNDPRDSFLPDGESPQDRMAYQRYLIEVQSGKSLLQLKAVSDALTPALRGRWSARTFRPIRTSLGLFDALVCNLSYHFHKHGQKYGTIQKMTDEAVRHFQAHRAEARTRPSDGLLVFPDGSLYEPDGRIVTFVG